MTQPNVLMSVMHGAASTHGVDLLHVLLATVQGDRVRELAAVRSHHVLR